MTEKMKAKIDKKEIWMQPSIFQILQSCCTSPELPIPELSDEKQKFLIFKNS